MNWYTSSYRKFNFDIITEPSVMLDDPGLDEAIGKEFIALFLKFRIRGVKPIKKLRALVEKYPNAPHFRYLLAEVLAVKSPELAELEMKALAEKFPKHIYGIAYALMHSNGKEIKEFPLSKPMPELSEVIQSRWLFHPSEVFLYENAAMTYLLHHGKGDTAQARISRLKSMTPNGLRPELQAAIASQGKPQATKAASKEANAAPKLEAKAAEKPAAKAATPAAKAAPKSSSNASTATKSSGNDAKRKPKTAPKKPTRPSSKPS